MISVSPSNYNYRTVLNSIYINNENVLKSFLVNYGNIGIKNVGFITLAPLTDLEISNDRMNINQFEQLSSIIKKLDSSVRNMNVMCGVIVDKYNKEKNEHYIRLKKKTDYMVLDVKDILPNDGNLNYPIACAEKTCEAMDTDLFDYITHPDSFMNSNLTTNPEAEEVYKKNVAKATSMICNKAKEKNIPIEFDMTSLGEVNSDFWTYARKNSNKIITNFDIVEPSQIYNYRNVESNADTYLENSSSIEKDYDPTEPKEIFYPYTYYWTKEKLKDIEQKYKNPTEEEKAKIRLYNKTDIDSVGNTIRYGIGEYYSIYTKELQSFTNISTQANNYQISSNKLAMLSNIFQTVNEVEKSYHCVGFEDYENIVPNVVAIKYDNTSKIAKDKLRNDIDNYVNNKNNTAPIPVPKVEEPVSAEKPMVKTKTKNNRGSSDMVLIIATIGITLVILTVITVAIFALAK